MLPFACINRSTSRTIESCQEGLTDLIARPVRQSVFAHASCFYSVLGCCAGGPSSRRAVMLSEFDVELTHTQLFRCIFVRRKRGELYNLPMNKVVPGGGISLDGERWVSCRPGFFLSVRVLSRLFRRLFLEKLIAAHQGGRLSFFGDNIHLADAQSFAACLAPLRKAEWVVYSKRPFGGPEAVLAYRSRYTHPPRCHRQQPPDRLRRAGRHLQVEGLPHRGPRSIQAHDTRHRRVHPPLPHPRAAQRLPPHPPLRPVRQRPLRRQHRTRP
jgi:Putative transposase